MAGPLAQKMTCLPLCPQLGWAQHSHRESKARSISLCAGLAPGVASAQGAAGAVACSPHLLSSLPFLLPASCFLLSLLVGLVSQGVWRKEALRGGHKTSRVQVSITQGNVEADDSL